MKFRNSTPSTTLFLLLGLLAAIILTTTPVTINADEIPDLPMAVNALPAIDLNGPITPGTGFAGSIYVEDGGPVSIVAPDLTITSDRSLLELATITLDHLPDAALETVDITANLEGTGLSKEYLRSKGKLKISGKASAELYQQVLRTVTYDYASDAPDTKNRNITFILKDEIGQGLPAVSTVAISATNDAPVLDNTGNMQLDFILEDNPSLIGNDVEDIIASAETTGIDRITDPDLTDPEGIAVIDVGDSNGTWEYTTDAGLTWSSFGLVDDSAAVLLDLESRVRFIPNANYSGQPSFEFRAWDQSSTEGAGEFADTSINGGTTAFSISSELATIDVQAVNDLPMLDLNGRLPAYNYAASFRSGNLPIPVTAPDAAVSDQDNSEIMSVTITLTKRPDGQKESLIATVEEAGIEITTYEPTNGMMELSGSASLDAYSAVLRGIRYENLATAINANARVIEFVAKDGTNSGEVRTSTLTPVLSNQAPLLDPAAQMHFTDVVEDNSDPAGDTIATLLTTVDPDPIQDPDPDAQRGFAVIEADNENGQWQFSIDDAQSWLAFGDVSSNNAVLLNSESRIRFLPQRNFSGETREIMIRAWDQTQGGNGLSGVDTTDNGGSTAFSEAKVSIPLYVQPVNDAPVLKISQSAPAQFSEGGGPVVVTGPALELVDVDNDKLQSAVISISNLIANEPDFLQAAINGTGISTDYDESTGILNLSGSATVAEYQAALRSVAFDNLSKDPDESDRFILFSVSDGVESSNEASANVTVKAVNDLPLLDLNGEAVEGTEHVVYYGEDAPVATGPIRLAEAAQIEDVDNTQLIGARVTLHNRPDGSAEMLSATLDGTNITAEYSTDLREIIFHGSDNLAAYQKVLRTVTYKNESSSPNAAVRKVYFSIEDASSGITTSLTRIVYRPQSALLPVIIQYDSSAPVIEEPNDSCKEALPIGTNQEYSFGTEDKNDWFVFTLRDTARVTVELTEFAPESGQLLAAEGICGSLKLLKQNGDYSTNKSLKLGEIQAGNYYLWLINDGKTNQGPYKLRVTTR